MKVIEKITRLPIREAFKDEFRDLTPWLAENIDTVSESLNLSIANAEREQSTGNFYADIKAETLDGRVVVIENQFGKSDHDHLGKLITYRTAFEAEVAIWIVEDARTEHINAISWLNESDNQCDFYLAKIEAIKIGSSNVAPLLTLIIGPSEETKVIGKVKKEDSERHKLRFRFWELVLEECQKKGMSLFNAISARTGPWMGASSGTKGLSYQFWVNQHSTWIELRIDRGQGSEEENLKLLELLAQHKEAIEHDFGDFLNWANDDGVRVCSVRKDYDNGGYRDSDLDAIVQELVLKMGALIAATHTHVKALPSS